MRDDVGKMHCEVIEVGVRGGKGLELRERDRTGRQRDSYPPGKESGFPF